MFIDRRCTLIGVAVVRVRIVFGSRCFCTVHIHMEALSGYCSLAVRSVIPKFRFVIEGFDCDFCRNFEGAI